MKPNVLICLGTRPEAIKMAPVIKELQRRDIPLKICVTAQHREMLDQVLAFFDIVPDFDLNLMSHNQTLNNLSSAIIRSLDEVLQHVKPDLVLVHGDTTTSSMAALAAFHQGIKVGHVEAGLRTNNKTSPFPEEVYRQITARIADFHFAPTQGAVENLWNENIPEGKIYLTGNTIVDALEWSKKRMEAKAVSKEIQSLNSRVSLKKKLILVTGHRRENFGSGFLHICEALEDLSRREDVQIVYPVHLNPNVKETVFKRLDKIENILLIKPVAYSTMLWLISRSSLIISDSGGIQEEAPSFGKPLLITREVSERMEGVTKGFSNLTGTDKVKIVNCANTLLDSPPELSEISNPYGDGHAASRIVQVIQSQSDF